MNEYNLQSYCNIIDNGQMNRSDEFKSIPSPNNIVANQRYGYITFGGKFELLLIMNKLTEYAKQPQYIMMFLGVIFLLGIAFIMYKKPSMLKNLMNPSQQNVSPMPPIEETEEDIQDSMNGDL